jgi:tetratricopeptide (TPR) repeat protein
MIRAARFKPSPLWIGIALGSMFLCSAGALTEEALWKMYFDAGTKAYNHDQYATAETMFLAARKEAEGFGSSDVRVASTLFQLALVYYTEKKYEQAEPNYRRAVEIWDKAKAPPSIERANALSYLGILRARQGDQQDAQRFYKQALDMREKLHGPADPELIIPLTNLAGNLRDQKKYDEAEPLYKRAQDIAEKHFGPDDPQVVAALAAQAGDFYDEEKYAEAEPLYVRALAITEKKKGGEDPDIVASIRPLAVTLFAQKKFDQARLLTERAIAILEKNNEPMDLAAPLNFLGQICERLHSYADAERAYKRALDTLGPDNKAALDTLENYSRMLHDLKRQPEAKALEAHISKIRAATQLEEKR